MFDHDEYLKGAITTNVESLEDEYVRVPSDLAYFSEQFADAHKEFLLKKLSAAETRARLYLIHREQAKEKGRATEAEIAALVDTDPEMHESMIEYIKAEVSRQKALSIVEAVKSKKDTLIGLGALVRAQVTSNISINRK